MTEKTISKNQKGYAFASLTIFRAIISITVLILTGLPDFETIELCLRILKYLLDLLIKRIRGLLRMGAKTYGNEIASIFVVRKRYAERLYAYRS